MVYDTPLNYALSQFNCEYDHCDAWGSVQNWRFNIANELCLRGVETPDKWDYKPGAGGPHEAEDGDYDLTTMKSDDLIAFGNLLMNFADMIREAGKDY